MEQAKETPPPQYAEPLPDTGSMSSMESKRAYGTRMSKRKASPQQQAFLLSKATSQATAAAKSILISGGTDDTALLTARAAAESVLVAQPGEKFPVFPNKRQAKQQAQVVASMALISALGTETNIFMQAPGANSFSGSRKSKPPSVIRQTSASRREDLSSVGYGESFEDHATEKNTNKALVKHARSNQSSNANTGQIGGLPPTHPHSSPKSSQSGRKKPSPSRQQYSSKEKSSPTSISSRTNASSNSEKAVVRQDGSTNSKDSYFAKRRAREQEKKESQNLVKCIHDDDLIYDSAPQLDIVEDPSSYDTDDNSRSVGMTDDEEEEEKTVSSDDAFESVDLEKKPKETPITFGNIVDGMLCGACNVQSNKAEERDDDGDDHSHDSDNSDFSSREDMDDLEEPISPVVRSSARKWLPKSPKAKTEHLKNPPKVDPVVLLVKDSVVVDLQPVPELKKPDKPKQFMRKSGKKKKQDKKKRCKESMEKVVLRALASNDASIDRNESLAASKTEDSTHGNSSFSSKKSKLSRGARISNWMRRKPKK